ncbi:hypothetical protein F0562_028834 [Nyssa sinensis]|uniref:non-specific serine/threonine protein kinase n=1 Tax=Nyssa sinensis TaxID=561372 RepID=A0A5J5B2B0_9ASTE|nr:hypothetical protein F0562_028834 [Nyssa sinensis]
MIDGCSLFLFIIPVKCQTLQQQKDLSSDSLIDLSGSHLQGQGDRRLSPVEYWSRWEQGRMRALRSSLSFNFNSFGPNDNNITYEGACPANGVIQLTINQRDKPMVASIGRATYSKPLQLWDKASGNLTDFTTHLSFVINSQNRTSYGDGIAFFLAPNADIAIYQDASISVEGLQLTPPNGRPDERVWHAGRATCKQSLHPWDKASGNMTDFYTYFSFVVNSEGSSNYADGLAFFLVPSGSNIHVTRADALGLPIVTHTKNPTSDFVAVEFDSHHNDNRTDPDNISGSHVGININSLHSNASEKWLSDIPHGKENKAWIRCNSTSQILSVAFTNFINDTEVIHNFSYPIDLRMHLPEWVDVGFSASTRLYFERHIVKSWEFSSNLQIDQIQGPKKALMVGLSVGLCVLVIGLGLVGIGLWKKRSKAKEGDEFIFDLSMDDDEFEKGSGPKKFCFPSITTELNADIRTYRDADISDEGLQLTPKGIVGEQIWRAGRATYKEPLHLWDKASGNLTDFDTSFSFIIDSEGRPTYADGLAFFLVPNGSQIEVARAYGLGLPINHATGNPTSNFVAVEFDTIHNSEWDLDNKSGPHVGININSVRSIASENWTTDIPRGKENRAWIRYNSTLQILTVAFTNFINDTQVIHNFTYPINLRMHLPEWVDVGFSASTGGLAELHIVKSWEFGSNLQIDQGLEIDQGTKKALVVGLSVGSCVLVLGLGLVGIGLWKKRSRANEDGSVFDHSMDDEFEKDSGPKKFSYGELASATNNFAEEEKLGEGGFGGVYRGFLRESYSFIAVKKVSSRSQQGIKEYKSEVKIISRLRHRNLVQLIGWCHEKGAFLLVYEFMSNGSLDSHLFNGKSLLNWVMRYRIAQALGSVLLYLHEEWEQCVVHRDIKSSNVMLDSNFNAKLGDFGLARLVDHEQGSQTTAIAGTLGYLAPECFTTGKASKKSDVYSFGIVALEIACGRKAIDPNAPESQKTMVEWVWNLYGMGKLLEAADPKLGANFDEEQMERLMIVGLWCANPRYTDRPSIRQATRVLHSESSLPILPSKMPVPTISAPQASMATFSISSS